MGFFKRLFGGGRRGGYPLGTVDPDHPARLEIDAAVKVGESAITLTQWGYQTSGGDVERLVARIERAIEKAPADLDLLVAKSGALCAFAQYKSAEELIDEVLGRDAGHFESRMRKDHWENWEHLFCYPPWSEQASALHPVMGARLEAGQSVQIVRDGLQLGVAVVRAASRQDFPKGLSSRMRCKWEPRWSAAPGTAIVAHYMVIEDNPADPFKGEGFLPTFVPGKGVPGAGYWLLKRLERLRSCFLTLVTPGGEVMLNTRFRFPVELTRSLGEICRKMDAQDAREDIPAFQHACRWHMDNFDLKQIRFA